MPISYYILLPLFTYWYYTSIDHKVSIIIVFVFCPHSSPFQVLPFYLLSYYDRNYFWLLSLCGITEKYWALEIQSYSSSSFWHTDFFHKKQVVGRGGHLGIATTQHIIYTSKNSKSIYHAAAPLHRVVRNIGAPTLSCQKAAWAMWNCQIILAFVWNCKSIYIASEMFSEKICILSELQEYLVWMCMRCPQFTLFLFIV